MASVELRNKTENIAPAGDEWLFAQDAANPFTVKKMNLTTLANYIVLTTLANYIVQPIGTRIMYDGATTPDNYLYCDGSAVSRSTYADLFSAIGTTFGVGDGSTTFNIPNLQGLSPKGVGDAIISGRTKAGPVSLGEVQEDQMQRITGSASRANVSAGTVAGSFGSNGIIDASYGTGGYIFTDLTFNSANSPDARTSATTDGNTRDSTMGTKFYIKYK